MVRVGLLRLLPVLLLVFLRLSFAVADAIHAAFKLTITFCRWNSLFSPLRLPILVIVPAHLFVVLNRFVAADVKRWVLWVFHSFQFEAANLLNLCPQRKREEDGVT